MLNTTLSLAQTLTDTAHCIFSSPRQLATELLASETDQIQPPNPKWQSRATCSPDKTLN